MLEINVYSAFLKDMRTGARFDWCGRLFQSLEPLNENVADHLRSFFWYCEICGSISPIVQRIGEVCHKHINQVL